MARTLRLLGHRRGSKLASAWFDLGEQPRDRKWRGEEGNTQPEGLGGGGGADARVSRGCPGARAAPGGLDPQSATYRRHGQSAREEAGLCQASGAPAPQRGCTFTGLETRPGRRSAVLGTQHFLELSFLWGRHLGAQRCWRESAYSVFFNDYGV